MICPRGTPTREHQGPQRKSAGSTVLKVLQRYGLVAIFPFEPHSGWVSSVPNVFRIVCEYLVILSLGITVLLAHIFLPERELGGAGQLMKTT